MAKRNDDSDKPLFEQAKHSLVQALTVGEFGVGDVLPPIEDLAARIRCSTGTMRRALTELAQEGLVKRIQRRGTVVTKRPSKGRVCFVLSTDLHTNMIFQDVVYGTLVGADYHVEVLPGFQNFQEVARQCRRMREAPHSLDSLIIIRPNLNTAADRALFEETAALFLRRVQYSIEDRNLFPATPLVATDQQQAAKDIMEHLLSLGHRKIAGFAGFSPGEDSYPSEFSRYSTHLLNVAGAEFIPHYGGLEKEDELNRLFKKEGVTAYCAITDHHAMLVVNICHRLGLRVPQDVSIVGRNDTPWSRECTPQLTTISLNPEGAGRALLECLERQNVGSKPLPYGYVMRVSPRLVVRESTGPAPKTRARSR